MSEKPTLLQHVQHELAQLALIEPELVVLALDCLATDDWDLTWTTSAEGPVAWLRIWPAGIGEGEHCHVARIVARQCAQWTDQDDANVLAQLAGAPDDASALGE